MPVERWDEWAMKMILPILCLFMAIPAHASQPTSKTYGSWRVISIWSLSGTEGNDASVMLLQGEDPNQFQIDWEQGSPVTVSINIDRCYKDTDDGEDDFEASYSVPVRRWLALSRNEMQKRVGNDLLNWLGQARLACKSTTAVNAFKVDKLVEATQDFLERLKAFAPEAHDVPKSH